MYHWSHLTPLLVFLFPVFPGYLDLFLSRRLLTFSFDLGSGRTCCVNSSPNPPLSEFLDTIAPPLWQFHTPVLSFPFLCLCLTAWCNPHPLFFFLTSFLGHTGRGRRRQNMSPTESLLRAHYSPQIFSSFPSGHIWSRCFLPLLPF